jgi:hypothetical protein
MDREKIRVSFETHRLDPDVTTEEYVRTRRIQLGKSVMGRERVYLDKRYWIILRDVALGRNDDQSAVELLAALRARVHSKQSICPISETLFLELLKQQDLHTRKATAVLIDELSEGVTLAPYPERVATELSHFFYLYGQRGELHPLHDLVWSKLSYVLGVQHPTNTIFDENEERVIQKAFFDHMWECSLSEMVDLIGSDIPPSFDYDAVAQKLNEESAKHAHEIKNFSQAYKAEMIGSLSLFMSVAREVLEDIFHRATGKKVQTSDYERREHENHLLAFFGAAIEKKEVVLALRTLHIGSLCHAAVRWDKKRKLTGNDLFDFHHAEAAIGYCNVFLTENPLRTMLQQNHLGVQRDFPCTVISSLLEATEWAKHVDG